MSGVQVPLPLPKYIDIKGSFDFDTTIFTVKYDAQDNIVNQGAFAAMNSGLEFICAGDVVNLVGVEWGDLVFSNNCTHNKYQSTIVDLRIDDSLTILKSDIISQRG
ncbi:MAG: hypothetical protein HOH19_00355 [Kordiimonadaceae bacterium]|nr:hypothetical protein [Kordiimonadaceae bacterium]MBT6030999.1 hypothetical protein [Kordiimonadaceae bacterium]